MAPAVVVVVVVGNCRRWGVAGYIPDEWGASSEALSNKPRAMAAAGWMDRRMDGWMGHMQGFLLTVIRVIHQNPRLRPERGGRRMRRMGTRIRANVSLETKNMLACTTSACTLARGDPGLSTVQPRPGGDGRARMGYAVRNSWEVADCGIWRQLQT